MLLSIEVIRLDEKEKDLSDKARMLNGNIEKIYEDRGYVMVEIRLPHHPGPDHIDDVVNREMAEHYDWLLETLHLGKIQLLQVD